MVKRSAYSPPEADAKAAKPKVQKSNNYKEEQSRFEDTIEAFDFVTEKFKSHAGVKDLTNLSKCSRASEHATSSKRFNDVVLCYTMELNQDGVDCTPQKVLSHSGNAGIPDLFEHFSGQSIRSSQIPQVLQKLPCKGLVLAGSKCGPAAIAAIADNLPRNLTSLSLTVPRIGNFGVSAIARKLPPNLKELVIGPCSTGSKGIQTIAENLPQTLTLLKIWGNDTRTASGFKHLAKKLPRQLTTVILSHNKIDKDTAIKLVKNLPTTVTDLKIDEPGVEDIAFWHQPNNGMVSHLPKSLKTLTLGNDGKSK